MVAAASAVSCFGEARQALLLITREGGEIVYYLDQEPQITFGTQQMLVREGSDTHTIPMGDIDRWAVVRSAVASMCQGAASPCGRRKASAWRCIASAARWWARAAVRTRNSPSPPVCISWWRVNIHSKSQFVKKTSS